MEHSRRQIQTVAALWPPEKGGKGPLMVVVVFVSIMLIGIGAAILVPMYAGYVDQANVTEASN